MKKTKLLSLSLSLLVLIACSNTGRGKIVSDSNQISFSTTQSDVITLTIGSFNDFRYNGSLAEAIILFNSKNTKYQFKLELYGNIYEDPANIVNYISVNDSSYRINNDTVSKVGTDLLNNKMPDIMVLTGLPYREYAEKGIFVDLYDYFDTDDLFSLNREDFYEGPLSSMEYKGKLNWLSPAIKFISGTGKSSLISDCGSSFDKLFNRWQSEYDMKNTTFAFNNYDWFHGMSAYEAFCLSGNYFDKFINNENKSNSFNSPEFIEALESYSRIDDHGYKGEFINDTITFIYDDMKSGKAALYFYEYTLFNDYIGTETSAEGEPYAFTGLLDADGALCVPLIPLAISAKSENQDVAWQFLNLMLTDCTPHSASSYMAPYILLNKQADLESMSHFVFKYKSKKTLLN